MYTKDIGFALITMGIGTGTRVVKAGVTNNILPRHPDSESKDDET